MTGALCTSSDPTRKYFGMTLFISPTMEQNKAGLRGASDELRISEVSIREVQQKTAQFNLAVYRGKLRLRKCSAKGRFCKLTSALH